MRGAALIWISGPARRSRRRRQRRRWLKAGAGAGTRILTCINGRSDAPD